MRCERRRRNADVRQMDRAAKRPPGVKQMPGLQAEEGDGRRGLDGHPADLAGLPVDAGGNVDRDNLSPGAGEGVDPLDDRLRLALDVARQPGAEQRVDHAIGVAEIDVGGRADEALKSRRGDRGVASKRIAAADEPELDDVAASSEQPGGDEAVAAVSPRTAKDGDAPARARLPGRFVGDGKPCPLHQHDARRSGGDGEPVGLRHLGRGQEFWVFPRVEHQREGSLFAAATRGENALSIAPDFCYTPDALIPDSSAGRAFDC